MLKFINGYVAAANDSASAVQEYVINSGLLTVDFRASYTKLLSDAWEEDHEFGLGFDPISPL